MTILHFYQRCGSCSWPGGMSKWLKMAFTLAQECWPLIRLQPPKLKDHQIIDFSYRDREAEAAIGNPEVACWWLRLKLSSDWSTLIHAMADCIRIDGPRLDDTHFFFAHIGCTQTYSSRGPIRLITKILLFNCSVWEVVSTGPWLGCKNTCFHWSNCQRPCRCFNS